MALIKVIRVGQPVVDFNVETGTTLGDFLTANGLSTDGVALVFNGANASAESLVMGDSTLLLAPAVKGGVV